MAAGASDQLAALTPVRPVNPQAAYELVVEQLRRLIRLGVFAADERLPVERELAALLGVSRLTLRQALHTLQAEGYVGVRRGATGGTFALPDGTPPSGELSRLLERPEEFRALVEFRLANESMVARLAAERRSRRDLEVLAEANESLREATSTAEFRRSDNAFHLTLAASARNPLFVRTVEEARAAWFAPVEAADPELLIADNVAAHGRILEAVRDGDGDAAEVAMKVHIEQAEREFHATVGALAAPRPAAEGA